MEHYICDNDFKPTLSKRVNIHDYCKKLLKNSELISYHSNQKLEGVVAIYCNDYENHLAYISSICVKPQSRGKKIGDKLLDSAIIHAKKQGMRALKLEVGKENIIAISLYRKKGFSIVEEAKNTVFMKIDVLNAC